MTALQSAEAGVEPVSASENCCARSRSNRLRQRPMPHDFVELAPTMSVNALARRYITGTSTIHRWASEGQVALQPSRCDPKEVPADFRSQAKIMHRTALSRHYRVQIKTINRWGATEGVSFIRPPLVGRAAQRDVPSGFAAVAPTLTRRQLQVQCQASAETVDRWLKEARVSAKISTSGRPVAPIPSATNGSVHGEAAHFLRRYFPSVYRADILPKKQRSFYPNHGADMWIVAGHGAVGAEKLLEMAKAKGFDPDAWSKI